MKLYATPCSLHDDLDLCMKEWCGDKRNEQGGRNVLYPPGKHASSVKGR